MIGKLGLAPMAGVTNWSFRKLCFEYGAHFAFSEMISADSVVRNISINKKYFPRSEEKDKVAIQIFGSDPFIMAQAAKEIEEFGAWIDINAGCPVKKIVKKGAGSALLRDLKKLKKIISEIKKEVTSKVSVKVRLGWEKNEFEKIYDAIVEAGADAIFVHGRTAKQMYSGKAIWNVKNKGYIPFYINGDIKSLNDMKIATEFSGADGVLIGRGAIGSPWIFSKESVTLEERLRVVLKHLELLYEEIGNRAAIEFRKFIFGYTKNMRNAREFRMKVMKIETVEKLKQVFREFFEEKVFNEKIS